MAAGNEHLDRAIELYREEEHRAALIDPGVAALAISGPASWHLGFDERSRRRAAQALELAERIEKPYDVAFARDHAGMLYIALEEPDAVLAHAEALVSLSSDQHLPLFAAHGVMQRAWALARLGRDDEGLAELRRGLALLVETGERLGLGFYLSLLAEILAARGEASEARSVIDDALGAVPEERHDKPEILRRRGDLLVEADAAAAEESYREAIAVARQAGSIPPELRAATALERLFAAQRRGAEAG